MDRAYLHLRLRYEAETGMLFWRYCASARPQWNAKHAGRPAFTATERGYRVGRIDGVKFYAHRVVYAMLHGAWPEQIDHDNRDRGDNRPRNLKAAGPVANSRNQPMRSGNTSGVTGVSWDSHRGRWSARIGHAHLGRFDDFDAAVCARRSAEVALSYHPNHGRNA
jgi:hypothetical protein